MPFTLSHIAAAFPFRRLRLDWSALIVGTTAPDLEYFLRLEPGQPYGHTLPGVFLLTLPLALITLWLFHSFVKAPFVELLPEGLQRKLAPYMGRYRFGGAKRFGLVVASVLIGALTHIAWDSFTHGNTWLVHEWSPLRHRVHLGFIGPQPLYKLLQHGSTLFGLTVLAVAISTWYRNAEPSGLLPKDHQTVSPPRKVVTFLIVATIGLIAGLAYAISVAGVPTRHSSFSNFVGPLVVTTIAAIWWQFVLLGIVRRGRANRSDSA